MKHPGEPTEADFAKMLKSICELARQVPVILRVGDCALCGYDTLFVARIDAVELLEHRTIGECSHCGAKAAMVGAV